MEEESCFVCFTHWQDKSIDLGTFHHMDTPGDLRHFKDVLVLVYQEINRSLHQLVKRVSNWEKMLCKLLHVLRYRQ